MMKDFNTLSDRGQMRRMRKLAEVALVPYQIDSVGLTLINPIENTTYRVDAASDQRYCLRIHRPGGDVATIRSELLWLAAIRRDTDLVVPDPMVASDGSLVTVAAMDGVPGSRCCVLFRWVEGRFVHQTQQLSLDMIARVGTFMARLHRHAEHWIPPHEFVRGRIDHATLHDPAFVATGLAKGAPLLTAGDDAIITTTIERVAATLQVLGEGSQVFGLIHADLVPANYLFHNGEVRGIDFDDCMWSYYLYDIALALRALEDTENYPALRAAFLNGYRNMRALAWDPEAHLETFLAMSHVVRLLWVLEHVDHPAYRDWAPTFVARSMQKLRAFLRAPASGD
jgi:Ser/Thr protein kinase RdoA (MazF antagonist)